MQHGEKIINKQILLKYSDIYNKINRLSLIIYYYSMQIYTLKMLPTDGHRYIMQLWQIILKPQKLFLIRKSLSMLVDLIYLYNMQIFETFV